MKLMSDIDKLRLSIDEWGSALVREMQWLREAIVANSIEHRAEPIAHDDYVDLGNDYISAKCLNCNNAKACKSEHWRGCVYEPTDELTCETCKHYKYIAHEWQCETEKCQGYELKQTKPCSNCQEFDCYGCEYEQTEPKGEE